MIGVAQRWRDLFSESLQENSSKEIFKRNKQEKQIKYKQ